MDDRWERASIDHADADPSDLTIALAVIDRS
jgi:hypothetical protein